MAKLKCYYAHSLHLYGTPQEKRDIELLEKLGFEVVNPSEKKYQEKYPEGGMDYFVNLALSCSVGAFRAYPDGQIPSGVYKEISAMNDAGLPVIEIPWGLMRRGIENVEHTREWLRELGQR